ncbi:MAG: RidA family protein [Deferrisomatales bacterium]|nr:RidA family protein [Deferrisomatales bacterium]
MRTIIQTDQAPAAVGPYSQAVRAGGWVYTAGQIPLDPATMQLAAGDITAQTRRALENLAAVLAAAGCSMADVVKTTVFLTDLGEFAAMNAVYAEAFAEEPPARSTVQVAALPLGARVEIEAVAREPRGGAMDAADWTP